MPKPSNAYAKTLDYLYSRLPMFHRVGAAAYKANLDNTVAICKALGNPERKFRSIHIAGTNGKGSTSHLLAAVFQEAGYKTGLYTSPHLKDFRERIRINGKMIPKSRVVKFVEQHRPFFDTIEPSFFEWTVGLAFDYFAQEKVDVAIIETGLGGRLDSTNVVTPELSIITNISLDHTNLLGKTLPKIAAEKAGIIKRGVPVLIGETQEEVKTVFVNKARAVKAPIFFADKLVRVEDPRLQGGALRVTVKTKNHRDSLSCSLTGFYQVKNIATVLAACALLDEEETFRLRDVHVWKGIRDVVNLTGLKGRWQTLSEKPLTITDTGHNEAGIREVLRMIKATPHKKLHFVLGMVSDKDVSKVLAMLPKRATYYFCKASIPRALEVHALATAAKKHGLAGKTFTSVKQALKAAREAAGAKDLVFVGGSTFVVAEVL